MHISLIHSVLFLKERLKEDFLAFFLFVHFLSSDFMFICYPWWLAQEALSVVVPRWFFKFTVGDCHHQAFVEAFASFKNLILTFISVFK